MGTSFDVDLFVIGGGSGGVRASRIAAGHGARVALAEEHRLGGTCVIRGCVPKKLLMYAAQYGRSFEEAAGFGWSVNEPQHDWATLSRGLHAELDRLEGVYRRLLMASGVNVVEARATIVGPNCVAVGDDLFVARKILIATGATPEKPDVPGADLMVTSNEVFQLQRRPQHVVIVGGGYIACEFAGIFRGLGSDVVQLHRGEQVLRGFDGEQAAHLAAQIAHSGVSLRLGTQIASVESRGDKYLVTLSDGSALETDLVIAATGRRCNSRGLGLESAGVAVNSRGAIRVDRHSRTSSADIYAVGDVTDRVNLTPVAIAEGHAFADSLFGSKPREVNHENVPYAVFSQPQAASVGLSEELAAQIHQDCRVYTSTFRPMRATLSRSGESAFVKVVVDGSTDRVLGVHLVCADAAEIIQGFAVAVVAGLTKTQFDATIGVHPTLAEELVTLRSWRAPVLKQAQKQAAIV